MTASPTGTDTSVCQLRKGQAGKHRKPPITNVVSCPGQWARIFSRNMLYSYMRPESYIVFYTVLFRNFGCGIKW